MKDLLNSLVSKHTVGCVTLVFDFSSQYSTWEQLDYRLGLINTLPGSVAVAVHVNFPRLPR